MTAIKIADDLFEILSIIAVSDQISIKILRFFAISDQMLTHQVQSCMHGRRLTPDLEGGGGGGLDGDLYAVVLVMVVTSKIHDPKPARWSW